MILSIDLASRQTGWALFTSTQQLIDFGVIEPRPKSLSAEKRLPIIRNEIERLLKEHKPKLVLLEQPAGGAEDTSGPEKNWTVMSVLFMTHGVVRCLLEDCKIKWELVLPQQWQNRLGFHKRDRKGRKIAAKNYAIEKYKLSDSLEQDVYDAICIHDCYVYMKEWKENQEREEESAF